MKRVRISHKAFNNILVGAVVLLGLYIAMAPFYPRFQLWAKNIFDTTEGFAYQGRLAELSGSDIEPKQLPPEENTLLIPDIKLNEKVLEGENISVISDGSSWRLPNTSTPDAGGNTVIIGHRWSYSDPATFYNLDKMEVGDKFSVYWNKEEYVYEVFETKIVPPTRIEIEAPTEDARLTLYTCAPLWTATDRLVVTSKLILAPGEQS